MGAKWPEWTRVDDGERNTNWLKEVRRMKQKKITLTFQEDGTVTVEAHGFDGAGCQAATLPYERDLGGVMWRTPKAEAKAKATGRAVGEVQS